MYKSKVYVQMHAHPDTAEGCQFWDQLHSDPPLSCGPSLWSTDGRSVRAPHRPLTDPPHIHLQQTNTHSERNRQIVCMSQVSQF